jgi:hypothetical protein
MRIAFACEGRSIVSTLQKTGLVIPYLLAGLVLLIGGIVYWWVMA